MKNLLYIYLFISLLLLSACSDDPEINEQNSQAQQKSGSEVEQDQTESAKSDNDNESGMFSMGDFENLKEKNDLGTYESGPISFGIKSVTVKRGEINEAFLNGLPDGEVEFIKIVMNLTSKRNNINFTEENFQLKTDSGEKFKEPNALMSSVLDISYRGSGEYNVTVTYLLEKTKADDIQKINFYAKAPTDKNGQPLGKDINIDINFSK